MKDFLTASDEAVSSSIDAPTENDESFDEPPTIKRKYLKYSAKSDQHRDLERRN